MDLVGVANGVAAIESRMSHLESELGSQRSILTMSATESLKQELTRFEDDVSKAPVLTIQISLIKVSCPETR